MSDARFPYRCEAPTGGLRWSREGKLQQHFRIVSSGAAGYGPTTEEWRDVPTEADNVVRLPEVRIERRPGETEPLDADSQPKS